MELTLTPRLRLWGSPINPSLEPRPLPWQRRLAQTAPGRGWEVASRRRGGPGSASASPPRRRFSRPPPSCELVVSSVRGAALTQHRSPSARRTGSPERRSHAGRTRAGGAPAAARGHRAQTGTATPAPRPAARSSDWALPSGAGALHSCRGRSGTLRGLGGTASPRRQRASRSALPSSSKRSAPGTVVLKVWSADQRHQHHLGVD